MSDWKRLLSFTLALMMVLSLASYGLADEAKPKLTMLFSAGGSGKAITAAAKRFTEATGIETEVLLFSLNEIYEKQILSLSNGMSDLDIIAINDPWLPLMKDYLEPLNELGDEFLGAFIPGMLETFSADEQIFGIPVRMGGDVITYRTDKLVEAGIDPAGLKTWEDIYQAALKLTDKANGKYGWAMGLIEPSNVVKAWYEYLICYGGRIINEAGDGFDFNTPEGIEATKMFVKFVNDCCPPDVLSYAFNDQVESMASGSTSMSLLWTSRFPSVNAEGKEGYGQWAVLPHMPVGGDNGEAIACVDGWAVGLSKYSKNREAAMEFIKYIGSYDEQLRLAVNNSNSPTIAAIYDAPEYLAVIPQAENMNKAIAVARPRPQTEYFNSVQDELALYIKMACLGDLTVEDALAQCEKECMEILEDYR